MDRSVIKEMICLDHAIKEYMTNGQKIGRGINFTQFQVITHLLQHKEEDICQKDLEEVTGLKKASMTGCLDVLADKDLIYRETAKDDRRRNYIRPTEKLENLEEDVIRRGEKLEALMMKDIDENDLRAFFRVLDRFEKNIEEAEDEADL